MSIDFDLLSSLSSYPLNIVRGSVESILRAAGDIVWRGESLSLNIGVCTLELGSKQIMTIKWNESTSLIKSDPQQDQKIEPVIKAKISTKKISQLSKNMTGVRIPKVVK